MSERLNKLLALLHESSNDSFILFAIAKEYENLNNQEESLNYYQKLFELNSAYVGLYYHWGKLLEEINEIEKALEIYSLGIEVSLKQKDTHTENELRNAKYNCEILR